VSLQRKYAVLHSQTSKGKPVNYEPYTSMLFTYRDEVPEFSSGHSLVRLSTICRVTFLLLEDLHVGALCPMGISHELQI
jgi:hypothetical protein